MGSKLAVRSDVRRRASQCSGEALQAALQAVKPGLAPRETVEQSDCFVFQNGRVMTYNDEVACGATSPLNGFRGAVPGKPLLEALRKLRGKEVEVRPDAGGMLVTHGNEAVAIEFEPKITLPLEEIVMPARNAWQKLPDRFAEAVGMVQECARADDQIFYRTCVRVHPDYVEACDNARLARFRLKTGFLTPSLMRVAVARHVANLGMTLFAETDGWVHFKNPTAKLTMSCRRFAEDYPELDQFLKVKGREFRLPDGLAAAAGRAARVIGQDGEVVVHLTPGSVVFESSGVSCYRSSNQVDYAGPDRRFVVLLRTLTTIARLAGKSCMTEDRWFVSGRDWTFVAALVPPAKRRK